MNRYFCSGPTGYLNRDAYGDLLKRDDVKRAIFAALDFDDDTRALQDSLDALIAEAEALLANPQDESQQYRLSAVVAQAKKANHA